MLSDSATTITGFATITKNILNGLTARGWECHEIAHNLFSQPIMPGLKFEDGTTCDFTIHGNGREGYGKDVIVPYIRKLRPDVFGVLLDTFMVFPWFTELDLAPAKTFFYYPSDGGGGLPQNCEIILKKVDMPISMSKFAQKQALDVHGIKAGYIPHAVDLEIYRPADKNQAKAKWGLQGRFVVGTVARNQGRKMLDRTIKAMEIFCKGRPDVMLFMHTDPYDPAAVFDILHLIRRHNLENRVVFSGMRFFNGTNYKQMKDIYNAMDVFLLSTSGEGFGIPTIEAMACEVPVVVTDYTTTDEIVNDGNESAGYCAKVSSEITGSWVVERAVMDVPDCVEKLNILYKDAKLREQFGKNGRKKCEKEYDWNKVWNTWDETLRKMC